MGLFITFEGPDGCGKTSIINLIKEYYKNNEKLENLFYLMIMIKCHLERKHCFILQVELNI